MGCVAGTRCPRCAQALETLYHRLWRCPRWSALRAEAGITNVGLPPGLAATPGFDEAWRCVDEEERCVAQRWRVHVRRADCLRPRLLKNTDSKVVAETLVHAMRPTLRKEVHPTQRRVVAGRDLVRNVVELNTVAHPLHSMVQADELPVTVV